MPQATRRPTVILGMAIAVVTLGQACDSQPTRLDLSASDNGRTVAAEVGANIVVALDAIGPFYFGTPVVSSASVRFVGESDELPSQPNPGGGKTQRYTFEAVATGQAVITIPRDSPVPASSVFAITVQVY